MTLSRRIASYAAAALVTAAFPAALSAAPIVLDQWYTFGFGAAGTFGFNCLTCTLGVRSVFPGDPAWTITTNQSFTFLLTDGFQQGDSFTLFDFGVPVGATPGVAQDAGHTCVNDEVACFLDPLMSHNAFAQGVGAHSYEIRVDVSPFGGGAAFFCLDTGNDLCRSTPPIPEPSTYVLLATGLIAIAGVARRRHG